MQTAQTAETADWTEIDDPEALMQLYKQTGSREIRNKLVLAYSYIARSVAVEMNNTFHKYATIEEMVNQGVIAIIDSIDRFDPGHGVKFSTYAFTKVKGAVIDYVRKQDWLPRRVRRNAIRLNAVQDELTLQLGRSPTREEMAEALQMTPEEYDKCVYEVSGENMASFESMLMVGPQAHSLWPETKESDPEGRIDEEELKRALAQAIDSLNEQERTVLSLYYYENLTMKEISQVMQVSEQRIGQVNRKLITKLRTRLAEFMKG